ncbi:MAG TPA: DNA primase [Ginsengibacter sp.]|nr:DNA primase [Ginsengibacter sp.]
MISQDTIQQVISRIDIVELIGDFVNLKRRGANYLGLCPFHDERTPSFTVSPSKEIYKCFGCGKSGNAITFLMEHEKYSYVEAIRWLAQKYRIEIEETQTSPEQKLQQQVAESLHIINHFAQQFFSNSLTETDEGKSVGLGYLKQRGFRLSTLQKFQIGYCPSDDSFATAAIRNQYNPDLLIKSGLVVERDGKYRDNYRERIIFPIHNQSGRVIGFGARLIRQNDKAPKYINTPENEVYVKSRVLYGLWQSRQAIGKTDECLLVEGYTDVVSLHQAGIENVVASGGTSLTREQLRLIKKLTPNLTIFYDGDAAGIAAAGRGLDLALEEGLTVKIVMLPAPEDPDSYVNRFGAEALENYIRDHKQDFILFQLDMSLQEAGNDSNKKSAAVRKIAESVSRLIRPEDFTLRQDYIRKIAAKLNIEEEGLVNLVNSISREHLEKQHKRLLENQRNQISDSSSSPSSTIIPTAEGQDAEVDDLLRKDIFHERALIRCLIEYGNKPYQDGKSVAAYLLGEEKIRDFLSDETLLKISDIYSKLLSEGVTPEPRYFIYTDNQAISETAVSLIAFPFEVSKAWKEKYNQDVATKETQYLADIKSSLMYFELKRIRGMIVENEKELSTNPDDAQRLNILIETHKHLKEMEQSLAKEVGIVILK